MFAGFELPVGRSGWALCWGNFCCECLQSSSSEPVRFQRGVLTMAGPESKTDSQSCIGGLFIHNVYILLNPRFEFFPLQRVSPNVYLLRISVVVLWCGITE